jgi:hypothetical protein
MKTRFSFIKYIDREAFIWLAGLLYIALNQSYLTICPLKMLGFNHCPGCGLGLSIHYLFTLSIKESFNAHPFGIMALIIITYRIYTLQIDRIKKLLNNNINLGDIYE